MRKLHIAGSHTVCGMWRTSEQRCEEVPRVRKDDTGEVGVLPLLRENGVERHGREKNAC